jgi:PST family polysaccharide transporter
MASDDADTNVNAGLAKSIRHGVVWSTISSLVLRLGNLVLGIILARLLSPDDFGVYAVALTVQSVLMTLADIGMSVDLIRTSDPERRAPTVATVSLMSGASLALLMTVTAGPIASVLGEPDAASVITILSWTLLISSAGVVPYAKLQREFQQRKMFATSLADFAVGTSVTLVLVVVGLGPIALAIGRVVASFAATALQFVLTRLRPRFGFDKEIARSALRFGIPLASANLLSWALLNIDNVVIVRVSGATALGLYVLAFNISTWPMSAIGQAVRSVSLAGFSERSRNEETGDRGLGTALSLTWAAALPAGVLLAALSGPLVVVLYGDRWSAASGALAALGMFGALRVALDMMATYLMARGAARPVLYIQIVWFLSLIPAVIVGTHWKGIAGAGWSHLAVSAVLILPAYAFALRRLDVSPWALVSATWRPTLAAIPTWFVAHTAAEGLNDPVLALLAGGALGVLCYAALCLRWLRGLLPARSARRPAMSPRLDPEPEGAR